MRERISQDNLNQHHIIPSSRGGSNEPHNLATVDREMHNLYHKLFRNKKPDEIIKYLVKTFWNNQWHWVKEGR